MRHAAHAHPDVHFVAVSHSSADATDRWLGSLGSSRIAVGAGAPGDVEVVIDEQRELFAKWGLGVSSFWHVLSPWSLWAVYRLGADDGVWNRPTESGSRWQTAGSFGCDGKGVVRWGRAAQRADEIPDFEEAVRAVS